MSFLTAFHGTMAVAVLCVLLFAEETGVPLPPAPGEVILLAAGLLIAGGDLSPWVFLPLAVLSVTAGAFVGFTWTRLLGAPGLQMVARRLGITRQVDRLTERLQASGPVGIGLCRLFPGFRITTTLVAGAVRVERRTFLLGIIPAIVIWVISFTLLGALVGIPIVHLLGRVDQLALRGAVLFAVGVAGYLAARNVPALRGNDDGLLETPGRVRFAMALAIDLGAIASIVAGLDMVAHVVLGIEQIDDWVDAVSTTAITLLAYLVLARGGAGLTAGEALFRVTYRSHRWRRRSEIARETGLATDAQIAKTVRAEQPPAY